MKKAKERNKIYSLRDIGATTEVSHETARRILKDNDFKYTRTQKRVRVDAYTRGERLKFAKKWLKREKDWKYTVFTDECSFWLKKCKPNKLWTQDPYKEEALGVHGDKIHLWGAITSEGAISLEIFEDDLYADDYVDILKKKVKKIKELFPGKFIFQQDGSGVHRAGEVVTYLEKTMPDILINPEWPPYSPDLSPIENVWGWLKNQVNKEVPKTVDSLKKCIKKHWKAVNKEFLAPFYSSMPNRMRMVIENEGGKISY